MRIARILIGVVALVILVAVAAYASGAVYFVPEYQNVVVTRFGEVQYAVITGFDVTREADADQQIKTFRDRYPGRIEVGAGLYFKVPFLETAHYFDSRILFWEGEVKEISTMDLRTLVVDTSARWRILDAIKFYESLGSEQQALNRIGSVVGSNLEDQLSNTLLIEAVRNENLELETRVKKRLETVEEEGEVESAQIRYGRKQLIQMIEEPTAQELSERFGIQLVDVMITQLNYTEEVQQRVYDRMTSERKRIAARYRAQGERTRKEILGEVQRRKEELLSGARRQVQEILGEAEGRGIRIWANAYQKDPEFFRFQRSLKAYETGLDTEAVFVLSDDNQLLEFTTQTQP